MFPHHPSKSPHVRFKTNQISFPISTTSSTEATHVPPLHLRAAQGELTWRVSGVWFRAPTRERETACARILCEQMWAHAWDWELVRECCFGMLIFWGEKKIDYTNLVNIDLTLQIIFSPLIWDLNQRLFERHLVNESKPEVNHIF